MKSSRVETTTTSPGPDLEEMLRILDAASSLRKERERVAEHLNFDQLRARLRERLLAAAATTGDPVTPEEVDAAIEQYYGRLHAYQDPPLGPAVALAHLYVRRTAIASWMAGLLLLSLLTWGLFLRPTAPLTVTGQTQKALTSIMNDIRSQAAAIRAIANDPEASQRLDARLDEASTYQTLEDVSRLRTVESELEAMRARLEESYVIEVVHEPGRKSGVDTYITDSEGRRSAGYYLIVEARRSDGQALPRRIRNEESGDREEVTTWAERVPKEVYDRLVADKRADGLLDEYVFAVKKRGWLDDEIQMTGPDGNRLSRLGQITKW